MIVLDTSVLIDSLSSPKRSAHALRSTIERGERILIPSLVLYEWLRGPRLPKEIAAQEALFPSEAALVFGPGEAALSAKLYRSLKRPRGREIDLAIAACTILRDADLWTLNTEISPTYRNFGLPRTYCDLIDHNFQVASARLSNRAATARERFGLRGDLRTERRRPRWLANLCVVKPPVVASRPGRTFKAASDVA